MLLVKLCIKRPDATREGRERKLELENRYPPGVLVPILCMIRPLRVFRIFFQFVSVEVSWSTNPFFFFRFFALQRQSSDLELWMCSPGVEEPTLGSTEWVGSMPV